MKGVFDTKAGSGYDDDIVRRYHFPSRYLAVAKQLVGDWVVYRAPRRDGVNQGYIGAARVFSLEEDRSTPGHTYARMDQFLPFDRVVPFVIEGRYAEAPLRALPKRSLVGSALQGRSVRPLDDLDFAAIVRAGLSETLAPANARRLELDPAHVDPDTAALAAAPVEEQERRIEQVILNRKIREASFRRRVLEAYDSRCAVTGFRIINGGGKAEAQAAHIWPVSEGGPDVVQNGLALSATVHWLFDRHLISLTNDYRLLVAHNRVPPEVRSLISRQDEQILLPRDAELRPHPAYLARHREAYAAA